MCFKKLKKQRAPVRASRVFRFTNCEGEQKIF